ncbi:MAG: hypothetical protein FDZ75_07550 [Actinobacteria bacterium]|nr:MAG: hypothetical protein FDZ75_07550 [Actinomycetota bacterium]
MPSRVVRGRYYTVRGTLRPTHRSGSQAAWLKLYRWDARGRKWVYVKRFAGTGYGDDTNPYYQGRIAVPSAGYWSIYAEHPADSMNDFGRSSGWVGNVR